jgi:sulfonate transport system substrate-binding protein
VHVLTDAVGIAPSNSFLLAAHDYATKYPSTIAAVIDEAQRAWRWSSTHQDRIAEVLAAASGVDLSAEKVVAARGNYQVSFMTREVVRRQQSIADTFAKLGLIPHVIQVSEAVWTPNGKLAFAEGLIH